MKLPPYPDYKESKLHWLGRIPAHWPERRAKYYFREIDDRSQHGNDELLSVSHVTGVTPRSQKNVTMFKAESNIGHKLCQPGDLVINTMWAWMAALGVSSHAGIVSPSYGVYRLRDGTSYDHCYLDYLLRAEGYRTEYICRSTGIHSSRLRLYPDKFLSMHAICPPLEEQNAIAKFLSAQDRLIQKLIRIKRRTVELLKEQKRSLINHAVTRGLDPDVGLRPSGVEWIGDIPEHWKVRRLKQVARLNPSKSETQEHPDDGRKVVFLPMENISSSGSIDCRTKRHLSEIWNGFTYFRRGDVVVAKISPCFENGKGAYLQELDDDFGFGTTELIVLRPSNAVNGAFLRFATSTPQFLSMGVQCMTGVAGQQRIPLDFVKNYSICLPPVDEQRQLVESVREQVASIDLAIARAEREAALVREYRDRLIADVVFGKVDVRGIAVPEAAEADCPSPEDEEDFDDETAEAMENEE